MGYLLASPLRRLFDSPEKILNPFVHPGMTVVEPGPGMGFFTLPLARMVGPSGRVVVLEIQPKMLASLRRRAARSGLLERLDLRLVQPDTMGLADLAEKVDFALAFAVVHEMPSSKVFFLEAARALKQKGTLFLAEPSGHVTAADFDGELKDAAQAGLSVTGRPVVRRNLTALLAKV